MYTFMAAIRRKLMWALALAAAGTAAHAQDAGRTLTDLDFVALDGGRVQITLTLSQAAPQPAVFTVDKPARLSLDFPDTKMGLQERYRRVNLGNVRAVASAEARGRTRVVVELAESAPYRLDVENNKVVLQVDGGAPSTAIAAAGIGGPAAGSITGIDFRRGEKGEGRVVVRLSDPK
ncbi:MAG: AMIN domain-containing protein, partial [Hydrocarboniphaga effusa]|nr:AMIN domain-containing protein [Hydrocarboniphaga effusa]